MICDLWLRGNFEVSRTNRKEIILILEYDSAAADQQNQKALIFLVISEARGENFNLCPCLSSLS